MDFDIYELKIVISTNIKSKKEIILTKDLIHNTDQVTVSSELNSYPYVTYDVMYSRRRLIRLTYQERINFFFNKDKFKELLASYKTTITDKTDRNAVVENNIMIMLELLLPTKFPAVKDLKQSYKMVFNKDGFLDHLYEAFIYNQPFSYLKIDGKVYTTKRVIWLNDILNHPVYRKLLDHYRKFWVWCKEEKDNAKIIIEKTTQTLLEDINKVVLNNINLINTYISENNENKYSLYSASTDPTKRKISTTIQDFLLLYRIKHLLNILKNSDDMSIKINNEDMNKQLEDLIKQENVSLTEILHDSNNNKEFFILEQIIEILKQIKTDINNKPFPIDISKFLYKKNTDKSYELVDLTKKHSKNMKDLLREIEISYIKINKNTIKEDIEKYYRINVMFELPYSEVEKIYSDAKKIIPPVYRNFFYSILNQEYRRPFRETTNALLQDLIDCKTEDKVKEFFSFMEKIYEYFLKNNQEFKIKKSERNLLTVDVNYININQSTGVKREINIMVDFIEGEINDNNVNDIFCPFYSEHLGNEFDYLFRMFYYGTKAQDWDVTKNRMMFSLEKMSMSNMAISGNKRLEVIGKPIENKEQNKILENKVMPQQQEKNIESPKLDSYFLDKIVNNNKNIKAKLNELNKISRGEHIYDTNLLEYLKKNNLPLYNIIKKWGEKEFEKSDSIISELIKLKTKYAGDIDQLTYDLQRYQISFDDDEKYKKTYQQNLAYLYSAIVEALFENEDKKNWARTQLGGNHNITHKNKVHSNRITRKK